MAKLTREDVLKKAEELKNWGKWGPDDEIGTLNYITAERIAAACRLATTGKVFALGIPLGRNGPQSGTRQRFNPIHTMFRDGGAAPRTPEDVKAIGPDVLRHRIVVTYEAEAEEVTSEQIVRRIFEVVEVP